jgi:hypothetical protein
MPSRPAQTLPHIWVGRHVVVVRGHGTTNSPCSAFKSGRTGTALSTGEGSCGGELVADAVAAGLGKTAQQVALSMGYLAGCVSQVARSYNQYGPARLGDRCYQPARSSRLPDCPRAQGRCRLSMPWHAAQWTPACTWPSAHTGSPPIRASHTSKVIRGSREHGV